MLGELSREQEVPNEQIRRQEGHNLKLGEVANLAVLISSPSAAPIPIFHFQPHPTECFGEVVAVNFMANRYWFKLQTWEFTSISRKPVNGPQRRVNIRT